MTAWDLQYKWDSAEISVDFYFIFLKKITLKVVTLMWN
jgi:hypothetical protein